MISLSDVYPSIGTIYREVFSIEIAVVLNKEVPCKVLSQFNVICCGIRKDHTIPKLLLWKLFNSRKTWE